MTVTQLVGQAARHGFAVMRTEGGASLYPTRPDANCPAWLKVKLTENRQQVIDWLDRRAQPDHGPDDGARPDVIAPGEPEPP